MGVVHVYQILQMVQNRAKHHIFFCRLRHAKLISQAKSSYGGHQMWTSPSAYKSLTYYELDDVPDLPDPWINCSNGCIVGIDVKFGIRWIVAVS